MGPTPSNPMMFGGPHMFRDAGFEWHRSCELSFMDQLRRHPSAPHAARRSRERKDNGRSMDQKLLQGKVQAFAQRLLDETNGDPVRALGLLVLVLDGADLESADHAQRLVVEVRKALMPEGLAEVGKPVQHLAGDVTWEGIQHCLRCGAVLMRNCHERGTALATGYVYEIGPRFTSEERDDFDLCS